MRSGWPQPIIMMEVGGEREERRVGGMVVERVRMYSWQFCWGGGLLVGVLFDYLIFWEGKERGERTPQKKWRIKHIRTRRGPSSLSA